MNDDSSEARNIAAPAISSALSRRPKQNSRERPSQLRRGVELARREIGAVQDVRVTIQLLGVADEAQLAALHNAGFVSDAQGDMRELLDQQHADAVGGELFDERHEPRDDDGRETERELVGENIARLLDDRLGEHQHLLLPPDSEPARASSF